MHAITRTAHSRDYQRSSRSTIDVLSMVLPAIADHAHLFKKKRVSLNPVILVDTIVQDGAILTTSKYSEALTAFQRCQKLIISQEMDVLRGYKRAADVYA